ncbi:MAG: electron transfer flavoprotein subunit beta/FixA family protein [Candidatus Latescibacteria bacterium]|nr:electron transfer flavoprotein subunit beta/FixA family protein [Candidatus Latescibacterota bacterium]
MNLVVCISQVPDTAARVKIGSDEKHIDEQDVTYVVNPYDEYAVEAALQLKEAGEGTVTAVGIGPDRVSQALRNCLALGCDDAVHIMTSEPVDDPLQQANLYAAALQERPYDLILTGKQSVDDDTQAQGPMLATLLDLPCLTEVVSLEVTDGVVTITREVEGGKQSVSADLPAVITAQKGLNEPRYASLKGIMAAKKKEIAVIELDQGEATVEIDKLILPPTRPEGRIVGKGSEAVPELVRLLEEEAKIL